MRHNLIPPVLAELKSSYAGDARQGDCYELYLGGTTVTTNNGTDTHTISSFFPANFLCYWVACYVDTTITGCTSWGVGITAALTRYGTGLALTAGTATSPASFVNTELYPRWYQTATNLLFTAAGGGAVWTTGVIYYKAFGLQYRALTSGT